MANCCISRVPNFETEISLISRVSLGDQDAMAHIYARFASTVYSVALRVLRDRSTAEEVMQEVFIHIWRNPEVYLFRQGSLSGLLAMVARNRAVDMLRQRRPEDRTHDGMLACRTHLGDSAQEASVLHKVRRAMGSLPMQQRRVLGLSFFEGLTLTEIAASTSDSPNTVKAHLRRALLSLRKAGLIRQVQLLEETANEEKHANEPLHSISEGANMTTALLRHEPASLNGKAPIPTVASIRASSVRATLTSSLEPEK